MNTVIKKVSYILFLSVFLFFLFIWLYPYAYKSFQHTPASISYSPDKKFRLERHNILFVPFLQNPVIGTGCSECAGYVRLIRNDTNEVLNDKFYSMQLQISSIRWYSEYIIIKPLVVWDLPE